MSFGRSQFCNCMLWCACEAPWTCAAKLTYMMLERESRKVWGKRMPHTFSPLALGKTNAAYVFPTTFAAFFLRGVLYTVAMYCCLVTFEPDA